MYRGPASLCTCQSSHAPERRNYDEHNLDVKIKGKTIELHKTMFPHSKVRRECPLLDWLVVGWFIPHKTEVKGQTRVVRTHDHGGERGS